VSGYRAAASSAAVGAALAAVAFGAGGATQLGRTAAVEIVLVLGAGAIVAWLALHGRLDRLLDAPTPVPGMGVLGLFGAFVALTALSAAWSLSPDATLQETSRMLAYLAVLVLAVVAGCGAPSAGPVLACGLLAGGVTICTWALVTRVFPDTLAELVLGSRLEAPLGYSNALGGMAAMCVPLAIWLGSRRDASRLTTGLAYPALTVLLLTIALTQSRGALTAAVLAAGLWLVFAPLRLRSTPVIALPAACAAPVAGWALSKAAFTEELVPLSGREAVASDFGLMLVAACAVSLAGGLLVGHAAIGHPLSLGVRRRAGVAIAVVACLLPLAGLTSVAMSDRGLGPTVSDGVRNLTGEQASVPGGAARLRSVSSARGQYWRQAVRVFADEPLVGTGANTFTLARLPFREEPNQADHAHGFFAQTLADLGLAGALLAFALFGAWLFAAVRTLELRRQPRESPEGWSTERGAVTVLVLSVVAFGFQSAIDWTWFIPAPAVAALAAAGFVAARGPRPRAPDGAPSAALSVTARDRLRALWPATRPPVSRLVASSAVLLATVVCAWATWQPEASARATDRVYAGIEEGDLAAASRDADEARRLNPYSPDPLYAKSALLAAQERPIAAYRALEQAVLEHPRDPGTWLALARFELDTLDLPDRAQRSITGAFTADPYSPIAVDLAHRASAAQAPLTGP